MNIVVVTPPPVQPVSDEEAFFSLKITTDPAASVSAEPELAEVRRCVKAATEECERLTSRSFVQRTLRMTMPPMRGTERRGLLWHMNGGADAWQAIELLSGPVASVSSVKYYDDANVLQTVDPADYYLAQSLVPKLCFSSDFRPGMPYLREDAVQIEYVAGYPAVPADPGADPPTQADYRANIPDAVKQAILLGTHAYYDGLTPAERDSLLDAMANLVRGMQVVTL